MESQDNSNAVAVNIKPTRVLHFSDGVDEEILEESISELDSARKAEESVDPVSSHFYNLLYLVIYFYSYAFTVICSPVNLIFLENAQYQTRTKFYTRSIDPLKQ